MSQKLIAPLNKPNGNKKKKNQVKPAQYSKAIIKTIKKNLGLRKVNIRGIRNNNQKIRGRGDYSIDNFMPWNDDTASVGLVNHAARGAASAVGNIFGIGKQAGNAASWLSRAFGFGDYSINSNSLMSNNIAQFKNHGTIEFAHREFIGDLTSSVEFVNTAYPINPGNSVLFPWLSTIARNFEQYQMLGLIFEFKTMSATAVGTTNTGLGTVIMATDYDVLDGKYPDKRAMEITDFATSSAPCVSQIHPIECDPGQNVMKNLFIQTGNNIANYPDDPRFSAMGNFQVATVGMQSPSTVGELWVSYHVRLYKPQLELANGASTSCHQKLSVVLGVVQTLPALITSNPGALIVTSDGPGGTRTKVLCATTLGVGTYQISQGLISDNAIGTLQPTGGESDIGVFETAQVASNATYPNGANFRLANWANASSDASNGVGLLSNNPTSSLWIVTFKKVGDYVTLPVFFNVATTIHHDIYISPYTTPLLGKNDKSNDLVTLRNTIAQLQKKQEKTDAQFKELKNELQEEDQYQPVVQNVKYHDLDIGRNIEKIKEINLSDERYKDWNKVPTPSESKAVDRLVEAAISVLEKEKLESLTLAAVRDRIAQLKDLLEEDCVDMPRRIILVKHVKLCQRREIELENLA